MLYVIFRIAFAVLLAVFLSKILLKILRFKEIMDKERKRQTHSSEECLDICPECGHLRKENHRCP